MRENEADLTAADILQFAHTIPSTTRLPELEQQLLDKRVSGFPVVDEGRLVGVISRTDIIRQLCIEREVARTTSDFYRDESGFHEKPMESFQDIADRVGERIEELTVKEVMIGSPHTVSIDAPLDQIAQKFIDLHIHRLLVLDQGKLAGIITTTDLVRLIAEQKVGAR